MIKNIFFDFDGVILESIEAKSNAFYDLYLPHGEHIAKKVLVHHEKNGGMSRFEKFPFYHDNFLNKKINSIELKQLCDNFSSIVLDKVIKSKKVKGVESFLRKNYRKYKFWIITGTPTVEIRLILKKINFDLYFENAFGSPEKKDFWIRKVLANEKLILAESVFVGDAMADFIAAKNTGMKFILKNNYINKNFFKKNEIDYSFNNFNEFESIIHNI